MGVEVEKLFSDFNKKYKAEIFTQGTIIHSCTRIPFSSPEPNRMLYGGIPRGRIIEFCGAEGSGKTTTALDVVANAQKLFLSEWENEVADLESRDKLKAEEKERLAKLRENGPKRVLWIDTENTFDDEWAETLGVDVAQMYYMGPDSQYAEEIFEMCIQLINTGELGLVVIDSLAMMMSKQETEKTVEEKSYGGISMALTRFSKEVEGSCMKTNCALIGINQLRENINAAGYGGPTYSTPGGKCWKHVCSVRIMFKQGTPFDKNYNKVNKSDPNPYGHHVEMSILKTKVCKPDRKLGSYTLTYTDGIVPLVDTIEIAIFYDIIHKVGGWYKFVNPDGGELLTRIDENGDEAEIKVNGQAKLIAFLQEEENAYIREMIENFIMNQA
jgi:recombination protein RecA